MLCISSSGVFGSKLDMYPPVGIWSRSLLGCILLGVYCKFKGFSFQLKKGKSTNIVFISGVLMTLHWVAYFFALVYTNVAISMLAIFTYPVITTLLEPLFFDVKLKARSILLSLIIIVGIFYLLPNFDISSGDTIGLLFGLSSAIFYSFRNLLLKAEIESYNGSVLMWYQTVIAVVILIPSFFFSQPSLEVVLHDLPYLFGLGLITTALGHTIFLNSFNHFKISTASIMSGMQPVYGIILAMIFLNEIPSTRTILGGLIIMLCVVFESLASIKAKHS